MSKMSVPNKPGKFVLDGVTIIILPDSIEIETTRQQSSTEGQHKKKSGNGGSGKKKEEESMTDRILGNAADFVSGKLRL